MEKKTNKNRNSNELLVYFWSILFASLIIKFNSILNFQISDLYLPAFKLFGFFNKYHIGTSIPSLPKNYYKKSTGLR